MDIFLAMSGMLVAGGTMGYVSGFLMARAIYRGPNWPRRID